MKLKNCSKYIKYVYEYIWYGVNLGFFDINESNNFKNKLLNIDVKVDNNIPANASVVGYNLLLINEKRLKNEKLISEVLFHEFTHVLGNIYQYVYEKDSFLYILKDKYNKNNLKFIKNMERRNKLNINKYFDCGLIMIDEVAAEYVSIMMLSKKYNIPIGMKRKRYFDDYLVSYECGFEYFGFEEHIVSLFAKTLDLSNNQRNVFGICREIYDPDFVKNIIYKYLKFNKLKDLYKIVCYMGILYEYEEIRNGRSLNKFENKDIYFVYKNLIDLLINNIIYFEKNKSKALNIRNNK